MNKEYESSVLEEGDFDERVFLRPSANAEIGTPSIVSQNCLVQTSTGHVQYSTPLLGRELVGTRDSALTPSSEATQAVMQLHMLLDGMRPEATLYIRMMSATCPDNPLPNLLAAVKGYGEMLMKKLLPVNNCLWLNISCVYVCVHVCVRAR